jgi:hypothetical protein
MKRLSVISSLLVFLAAFAVAAWAQHDMSKMCTSLGECSKMMTEMTEMLRSGTLSPAEQREVLNHIERTSSIMQEMSRNPEVSPTPKQTQELEDISARLKRLREMQRGMGTKPGH